MKNFFLLFLGIIFSILHSTGQCTVGASITSYVPGGCFPGPATFVGTPTVNCPEAHHMKIKWIVDGMTEQQSTTTDFTATNNFQVTGEYIQSGISIVCYQLQLFDLNNVQLASDNSCIFDVIAGENLEIDVLDCNSACVHLQWPFISNATYTIDGQPVDLPTNLNYCFTTPGLHTVQASSTNGCATSNTYYVPLSAFDTDFSFSGHVYNDGNLNDIQQSFEPIVPSTGVLTILELGISVFPDANGNYYFNNIPTGNYSLQFSDPSGAWSASAENPKTFTLPMCSTFNFGVIPTFDLYAESASFNATTINCVSGTTSGVWLHNTGNQAFSVNITINYDNSLVVGPPAYGMTYTSSTPGQLSWDTISQAPGTTMFYAFHVVGPGPAFVGNIYSFAASMQLNDALGDPIFDQQWNQSSTVFCSYDPNVKSALPVGYRDEHFILADDEIEYKIEFQNTGTAPAFDVVLVDSLDMTLLDLTTFEPLYGSHDFYTELNADGRLRFVFDNINLPDSASDEPNSHGFVAFKIKPKTVDVGGDIIHNKAEIYFDQNDAIVTNTTWHEIFDCAWLNHGIDSLSYCANEVFLIDISSEFGEDYSWSLDAVPFLEQGPQLADSLGMAGGYTLTTHISNFLCSVDEDIVLEIHENPQVVLVDLSDEGFVSGPPGYYYDWYVDGILITSDDHDNVLSDFIAGMEHDIYALVTSEFGCTGQTNHVILASLNEFGLSTISLFPNPMQSDCQLVVPSGNWEIQIFNGIGQYTTSITNVRGRLNLTNDHFASSGIYFIRGINDEGRIVEAKLIVE